MPIDRKPEFFKGAQLKVAIIGCGYVGLPLALRFAEAGHKVTGFDTDPNKVSMLNAGKSYIEHIPQTKIQQFVNSKHFSATTDFARSRKRTPSSSVYRRLWMSAANLISATSNRPPSPSTLICKKASWSFLNQPRIPARRRSWCSPSSKRAACTAPSLPVRKTKISRAISSWPFRRSAKIPATSSLGWRKFQKSSAA